MKYQLRAASERKGKNRYQMLTSSSAKFNLRMGDLWPNDAYRQERYDPGHEFDRIELAIRLPTQGNQEDQTWRNNGFEWTYTVEAPWAVGQVGLGYVVLGQISYGDQFFSLRWAPFEKQSSLNGRLWFDIIQNKDGNTTSETDISHLIADYSEDPTTSADEPGSSAETLKIKIKLTPQGSTMMQIQASAKNNSGGTASVTTQAKLASSDSNTAMRLCVGAYRRRKCQRFWEDIEVKVSNLKIDQIAVPFPANPSYSSGLP